MAERTQWYDNQQLFEKMQVLQEQISELRLEMQRTTTLIRDYNGLREKVDKCENLLMANEGKRVGSKEMWGYIVGAIGVIIAVASFVLS